MHVHAGAAFVNFADGIDAAEIELRMDSVSIKVEGDRDDIQIARAFPYSKKCSFHTIGAREKSEFRGGRACAAVVVCMQRERGAIAAREVC